jgi:glutaredoxin
MNFNFGKNKNNADGYGYLWIILAVFFVLMVGGVCYKSDAFSSVKNMFTSGPSLKELDVIMFMSPECKWCQKTMEMLKKEGKDKDITVVDITKKEGQEIAKQFGADQQPIPSFISRKKKTGTVGYRESVGEIVKALTETNESPSSGETQVPQISGSGDGNLSMAIRDLQIVFFSRPGCPWCDKAKENCEQAGVIDSVRIIDITTDDGKQQAAQLLPPGSSGVPAFVSMVTKKTIIGYKPIDQVVQELK